MTRQEEAQRLVRLGVHDATSVLDEIADTADPLLALFMLERLIEVSPAGASGHRARLLHELASAVPLRRRLFAVLGASVALGEHLVASADSFAAEPVWACLLSDESGSGDLDRSGVVELRGDYRRELLQIAARDLLGDADLVDVTAQLSALADNTLRAALQLAGSPGVELTLLAMGKCGARELNYVSDVDVLFVSPDAEHGAATGCARRLMQICREVAWQVDAGLRPEGQQGPLVRSIDSYLAYYRKWADSWEFQALLKARWVTSLSGSPDVAQAWQRLIAPMVWTAASRPQFVADVQAMRRRVERHVGTGGEHDIKLGPGGLRDIEFAVQLLQLVHGQADAALRTPGTFAALDALTSGGYVGRADGAALRDSYRFLRLTEHRLQLHSLRRTHRLPSEPRQLRLLARSLGYHRPEVGPIRGGDSVENFLADWHRHRVQVRQLHEKLFYRPLLSAAARLPGDAIRLTSDAARQRLAVLGYADPSSALRHVSALTSGVSRRAAIQRSLLPVILAELANCPDPDAGLLAYRRVSEQLGRSPGFLRLMRDG
ncbi:MAG: bifunctional [glutamine synthetase] adenylyltransferase/[glutamine synthetase]-adenylyl-L-tyrosine phosphorylase, partial [Pseudonocardiaceae bacterium]